MTVPINPSALLMKDDNGTKVYSSTSKLTTTPRMTKQEVDGLKLKGIHKLLTSLTWAALVSMYAYIRKHLMPHG